MLNKVIHYIQSLRFVPHLIVYYCSSKQRRALLDYERDRWLLKNRFTRKGIKGFLFLLNIFPEYRSLFYIRSNSPWLAFFAHGAVNLFINTPEENIGKGLLLWHGFSTIINAQSIGEDCEIWHNVTIGKKTTLDRVDKPIILDRVRLCAGCIVIGHISVANDVTVAAGAVVTKSVKEGRTVAGVPAKEMN